MSFARKSKSKHLPVPPAPPDTEGWKRVLDERERQQVVEGFTLEYDRKHPDCRLFHAAEAYAWPPAYGRDRLEVPRRWWLPPEMWKPALDGNRARDLEKACALYLAEWERQLWAGHASTAARMRAKAIQYTKKLDRIMREEARQQGIRERALARRLAAEARKAERARAKEARRELRTKRR